MAEGLFELVGGLLAPAGALLLIAGIVFVIRQRAPVRDAHAARPSRLD